MFAAAGAMALSNPLFLNPLLLSQFISAQQSNTDEPKLNFNQVSTKQFIRRFSKDCQKNWAYMFKNIAYSFWWAIATTKFLLIVLGQKAPVD